MFGLVTRCPTYPAVQPLVVHWSRSEQLGTKPNEGQESWRGTQGNRCMAGPMEPEGRDAAGKPLLVRVSGSSGGDGHGSASSASIAVVVGSTAVAVAGSFEFGLSVSPASVRDGFLLPFFTFFLTKIDV